MEQSRRCILHFALTYWSWLLGVNCGVFSPLCVTQFKLRSLKLIKVGSVLEGISQNLFDHAFDLTLFSLDFLTIQILWSEGSSSGLVHNLFNFFQHLSGHGGTDVDGWTKVVSQYRFSFRYKTNAPKKETHQYRTKSAKC